MITSVLNNTEEINNNQFVDREIPNDVQNDDYFDFISFRSE
jgi:hypothetical protein